MTDTTGLCRDHSFETAHDICRRCGGEYCDLCLVYPLGVSKPLCKECAIAAGGVRSHVSRQAMPRKELRRKVKAFEERQARSGGAARPDFDDSVLTDPLAPTDEDLERIPQPDPVSVPGDGAAFADELGAAFNTPPPPDHKPDDEMAPPIDWNRPFG